MRHLKSYKVFESTNVSKEMVRDFLIDFSDNDIPVDVDIHQLDRGESKVLIFIGKEDNLIQSKELPYENIDNFISLNNYLTDEGYSLKVIYCSINTHDVPGTGRRPTTIREFDEFISKIKEIERFNSKNSLSLHKSFKLIDFCYIKL